MRPKRRQRCPPDICQRNEHRRRAVPNQASSHPPRTNSSLPGRLHRQRDHTRLQQHEERCLRYDAAAQADVPVELQQRPAGVPPGWHAAGEGASAGFQEGGGSPAEGLLRDLHQRCH